MPDITGHSPDRSARVVVAMDIDGAVIPPTMSDARRPMNIPAPGWTYSEFPELKGGAVIADPVVQLLRDLDAAPHVDACWHTSWWTSAEQVNAALGIAQWPMLATLGEYLREDGFNGRQLDWKTATVMRVLEALQPDDLLVWVDDEIAHFAHQDGVAGELAVHPQLVLVTPETFTGISPHDLSMIRFAARV